MRIAYVCADPGIAVFGHKGASIHAQSVLTELHRAGHELHLLTPRPAGEPPVPLAVHPLPPVGRGEAAERERAARHSDAAVAGLLDRIWPDLVYERYSLWGRSATAWARRHGVPGVLEVNAPLVEEQARYRELADRSGAERVARSALSAAGAVICVSEPVADWARRRSAHPERVHVLPNGVDPERIRPRTGPVTPADADAFTAGFVGTLKPWHGVETLVDALAGLAAADRSWRLRIVGEGPLGAELAARAAAAGIGDLLTLTGPVPAARIGTELARMDIACAPYPAGGDDYFSPLKIYEYLSAGLPIVASAVGQIPQALDHGRFGRLVPPGDAPALASALAGLRADEGRRRRLRGLTRQVALERHSWRSVVDRALELALNDPARAA